MKIIPIGVLEDNYSYILIDEKTKEAAVIDPVEPIKILNVISQTGAKLSSVFVTHHHWDHSGGNIELVAKKPGLAVYGADARIPEINYVCKDHEEFKLGSLEITPLHTPCHTKGHVCYYVVDPATNEKAVFTGDTLFVAGIGKFFEGDARDMYRILFHVITKLPDDTWVYCGHEYTKQNLKFALSLEPHNENLMAKWAWCQDKTITVPSTIGQEKLYNPFLRVNEQALQLVAGGKTDPVEVLHTLREMKNSFR
ncbi:beta-lactamase-like protein [Absidia repens]|uniref:hydroxyacylglutathione hydrolase n=1 Tax=Absidia repens TaxID=90262 RepID=A0A1X2HZ76_9FUNG|nr:beta-lactamase-like protein [Absidia repens]